MAVASIYLVFLVGTVTRCRCDITTAYNNNANGASQFGKLLKPPPPPLSQILPVPFHGGAGRTQRQNVDIGYQYQPPPPLPSPPLTQIPQFSQQTGFKFPAPFYKQYNFNFVPPPQPFTTTPAPSMFQKVSTWLFPSQQTSYDAETAYSSSNIVPMKKDCNPCNLVPWIPVIRYNLGAKNVHQNANPTYGPPSLTAQPQHAVQFQPQSFGQQNNEQIRIPQLSPGIPHAVYGPSNQAFNSAAGVISSTYGPPSPTHSIGFSSQSPLSSTFTASSYSSVPSSTYGIHSSAISQPSSSFLPNFSQDTSYHVPSPTYGPPTLLFTTSPPSYSVPLPVTPYGPPVTQYDPSALNNGLQPNNDVEILNNHGPSTDQQLPKVSQPTEFRNSYGEVITNTYALDVPYPVSATAAESTKVKTEVLPNGQAKPERPNMSMALANPAPFSLNRERNIHTLQPVALPNLSVSPLPPIFNARPFRPIPAPFPSNLLQGINHMQQRPNNVDVAQSVPLVEFTHSIDYPATYIQSPVIDIDTLNINNQTKGYRNIPNHFVIDDIRDISSQASEDHVSAAKTISDSSFESTGPEIGNDLYDNGIATELKLSLNSPSNHKLHFADLRGVKDEDVDKYRTESNLQNIDSPLLYLKPSAPHKSYGNFVLAVSTPGNDNEFEIYDDMPSTAAPLTLPSAWDESRTDYSEGIQPPPVNYEPKIVQIIVPYTTSKKEEQDASDQNLDQQDWSESSDEAFIGRKVPSDTDTPYSTVTENYSTLATTTNDPNPIEGYDSESEQISSAAILNDLYDVKEPPFDIVKLQHTIDDWTEKEYSKYKPPQKPRSGDKHAKKIPDEYFTTTIPTNYVTESNNYYDFYDHEGSSSNQHTVTNNNYFKLRNEYNNVERTKSRFSSAKNEETDDIDKLHIYTAASSFRTSTTTSSTTTTTPAPWGKIQTSISPLTKEKVYVVTSKPWRDASNVTKDWYEVESFESKKTNFEADNTASENLRFKSPRFMNRPSFGFTSGGKIESAKSDSSYEFSRSWYRSINELEIKNNSTSGPRDAIQRVATNSEEDTATTNRHKHK